MQIGNMMKTWFGNKKNLSQNTSKFATNEAANNTLNKSEDWLKNTSTNAGESAEKATKQAGEWVASSGSKLSNWGAKTQQGGSWWKKAIPLLLVLAVGFWAVSQITGFNPLSAVWDTTKSTTQTLEANIEGAVEATGNMAASTVETVKGTFSSFSLPNGENIEFAEGTFGYDLTAFLTENNSEENKVFTFDNLNFDTGSAQIKEESKEQLNKLGQVLDAIPNVKIKIEGHTDNAGKAAANKLLSQQRAEMVKQYLVTQSKIDSKRIATAGFGDEKPIVNNDTPENRAKNRRIDLVITHK